MPEATPKHIERSKGYDLPTVLCPRCSRAMAVKRVRHETTSAWGNTTKFFLKYHCKECGTEWEEEEKPKEANGWIILVVGLIIILTLVFLIGQLS